MNKEEVFNPQDYVAFGQSLEDVVDLKNLFDMLDKDKNGSIDPHELKDAFTELDLDLNIKTIYQIMAELDDDQSGMIEFPEFYKLWLGKVPNPNSRLSIQKTFDLFDLNNDGKITINELKLIANYLGEELEEEEFSDMFKKMDQNEDGFVMFEDFYQILFGQKFD